MQGLISEDYLMHHGVKGMKWGVRHDKQPLGKRLSNNAVNRIEKHRSQKMAETERYKNTKYGKWVRDVSNRNYDRASNIAKNGLSSKQKKVLKGVATGAALAGAGAIGVVALRSGVGKAAITKGARYLRMAKTDAKIMKIGVKDAIANSKSVNKGKAIVSNSKLVSNVSRKARMAKTDAKIVKIGTKDAARKTINRSLNSVDAKITRNKSKRVIRKAIKDENKLLKNALKDANSKHSPWPEASHVKNPTGKNREYDYGARTGISRIGKYKKYARVRVNSNTWKNRKY